MPGRTLLFALLLGLVSGAPVPARTPAVEIVVKDLAFSTTARPIHVGDTVTWVNKDVFDHTATARKGEWRVVVPAGKSASLVMRHAGTFEYYCEYHPTMKGRLVVAPARKK